MMETSDIGVATVAAVNNSVILPSPLCASAL